jgi:hypothetical protein
MGKKALPQNSLFGSLKIHQDIPRYGLNRYVESIQSKSGSRQTGSHSDKPARNSDFCGIAKKASPCRYVALDIHKHYSVIAAVNRDGEIVLDPVRIEH